MIDMNKQYTFNGKPVRIYADGNDTSSGMPHGAVMYGDNKWYSRAFLESDLVEVWQPKEGELCFFWDKINIVQLHIRKFKHINDEGFYLCESGVRFNHCAPFTGTLPEAFKGLTND